MAPPSSSVGAVATVATESPDDVESSVNAVGVLIAKPTKVSLKSTVGAGVAVTVSVDEPLSLTAALVAVTMYCGKLLPAFTTAAPAAVKVTSPLVVSMA